MSNNTPIATYWKTRERPKDLNDEPMLRIAQYEVGVKDTAYGEKIWIELLVSVGTEKRKFYSHLEFPVDSPFARDLRKFLNE